VTTLKNVKEISAAMLMQKLCRTKIDDYHNANNLALLNIPEPTYKYNEYRDGLVSDDFECNH